MTARLQESNGFTLVEVFAVLLIFIGGIVPLLKLQIATIDGNHAANQLTEATYLAESKMEQLFGRSYDDLHDADTSARTVDNYRVSWSRDIDSPITDTMTITVNVSWLDKKNRSHCVSLASIKGR